jgi:multidrug efflux pump subunit AcrA (membrane-fusion protein)
VEAARDRATQAKAYNDLTEVRTAEHATYVADVQARIAEREQALDELELALSLSQRRAATSTRKRNAEGRRAAGLQVRLAETEERARSAQLRIAELEQEVVALRSELDPVTAIDGGPDGLDLVRACLAVTDGHLAPGGSALLQVGPDQADPTSALVSAYDVLRVVEVRAFERGALLRIDRPG